MRELKRTMGWPSLALLAAVLLSPGFMVAEDSTFGPLLEASSARLLLAEQVAQSKFARSAPVQDVPRERQVLDGAVRQAEALGLAADYVRPIMTDQIEANKWVQYVLLAQWRVAGTGPDRPPVDLAGDIRPRLDRLQGELLQGLRQAQAKRGAADCQLQLDRATFAHAERKALDDLQRTALIRALVGVCG